MPIETKIYSTKEIGKMPTIRLTARHIRNLCRDGKFKGAYQEGRKWKIPEESLKKFLIKCKKETEKEQRKHLLRSLSSKDLKALKELAKISFIKNRLGFKTSTSPSLALNVPVQGAHKSS